MTKQDLIAKIAKDTGSSKVGAAAALQSMIEGITKSLKKGDAITFVGFGTFKTAQRKARTARNPHMLRLRVLRCGPIPRLNLPVA